MADNPSDDVADDSANGAKAPETARCSTARLLESMLACVLLVCLLVNVPALVQEAMALGVLPIGIDPPGKPDGQKSNENYWDEEE